jgi:hypothetical protein
MASIRGFSIAAAAAFAIYWGAAALAVETASAHRSPCHSARTCPSDDASYRWRGLLTVAADSAKRTTSFSKRITYGGRTYYARR